MSCESEGLAAPRPQSVGAPRLRLFGVIHICSYNSMQRLSGTNQGFRTGGWNKHMPDTLPLHPAGLFEMPEFRVSYSANSQHKGRARRRSSTCSWRMPLKAGAWSSRCGVLLAKHPKYPLTSQSPLQVLVFLIHKQASVFRRERERKKQVVHITKHRLKVSILMPLVKMSQNSTYSPATWMDSSTLPTTLESRFTASVSADSGEHDGWKTWGAFCLLASVYLRRYNKHIYILPSGVVRGRASQSGGGLSAFEVTDACFPRFLLQNALLHLEDVCSP